MDTSAVVLNKLLAEQNLELWARLKLVFLDPAYSSLYSAINKHYEKYHSVPSFDDLALTIREGPASKTLATLRLTEVPDVSAEIAAAIDKTERGLKTLLTRRGIKVADYDGAAKRDKADGKKAA